MYSGYPRKDRVRIRFTLAAAWFFTAVWGAASIFLTPTTVQDELGLHLPNITGAIVLSSSVVAIYGVVRDKYYLEYVAAWFAVGGAFVYVITVWGLVIFSTPTRLQQAAALTSLLFFYLFRVAVNTAHAVKLRTIHEKVQSGQVKLPDA